MTNASASANTVSLLLGRYRIFEALGNGRLTTVYSAIDERLQRKVLFHILRKDLLSQEHLRRRFTEEINTSAQRSHAALLEIFDSGEEHDRPFMITEYVTGQTLSALGALTLEQALLYTKQVAGAIAVCQACQSPQFPIGLPHPPISTTNVIIVDEGRVKLIENWMTPLADIPLDLAHYRAPERTEGLPPTRAVAVYALGLLLYELITGTRPISGADARAVAQAHRTSTIPSLRQTQPRLYIPTLEQLLVRSTAHLPEQRLPDADTFSAALDALWRDLSQSTQHLPVITAAPRAPAIRPSTPVAPAQTPQTPLRPDQAESIRPMSRTLIRRQAFTRGLIGWLIMLVLILGVAFAGYTGASYIVNQFFAVELPQLDSANLKQFLPKWMPVGNQGEALIVNSVEGLHIRSQPTIDDSTIITAVPNGTVVTKLEGPVVTNNGEWVRVRTNVNGKQLEGWMSLKFLKAGP